MEADFQNQHDKVRFLYWSDEKWKQIGPWHQLYFKIDVYKRQVLNSPALTVMFPLMRAVIVLPATYSKVAQI